jgi:hypothetical protein
MSTSSLPDQNADGEGDVPPRPFGFRTIVVLIALYLGYRVVQGIVWAVHRLGG